MKSKSILIIGNYPPPFGGVPRHIEYLIPYLVDNGWKVHVLSGGSSGIEYKVGFTVYKPTRKLKLRMLMKTFTKPSIGAGIKLMPVFFGFPSDWIRYMVYINLGLTVIENEKIDIISAYNLYSYAPIGAVLSEMTGLPLVVTNFGEIYSQEKFLKKNIKLLEYVCKTAKKLLAMSSHCAESYKMLGLSPVVDVVPYGVDLTEFSPENDKMNIRRKYGISMRDKVILFLARQTREMGLHTLIESIPLILKENKIVKFIIAGEIGELFQSAIELEKFHSNVFVEPSVPLEDLPLFYAASTLLVVPTQGNRACGSLSAIEGMASGKPVIASDIGGLDEIIVDGETGFLVSPEKPQLLAEAVLNLIDDMNLIEKMGRCGRERVKSLFDKDQANESMENLFSSIGNT